LSADPLLLPTTGRHHRDDARHGRWPAPRITTRSSS